MVYAAQFPAYLYLLLKNVRYWTKPSGLSHINGWIFEHQRCMMFVVQVTIFTGLANVTLKHNSALTLPCWLRYAPG